MQNGEHGTGKSTVGIYGGSFNPPHIGHLIVAETVREQFQLDEVWWMPCDTPPHKSNSDLASTEHRMQMTRIATADNPHFRVSDAEIKRGGVSYTVDTISDLQQQYPDTIFTLVIGSDSLDGFADWHKPDEIIRKVPLYVYKRPGVEEPNVPERFADRVSFATAPLIDVSGTDIRRRIKEGESIRYLLPDEVRAYLDENALYRSTKAVS